MPLGGLTAEFVEEELSEFGYKFEGGQDFVDKLDLLSYTLNLASDDLVSRVMLYAWYVKTKKMDVDFLDAFEQCYKNKEAHVWAKRWLDLSHLNRQRNEEAMFDIANHADEKLMTYRAYLAAKKCAVEEHPRAMEYAAALEDANRAMLEEDFDQQGDEETMFDIADDAEEQPPAMALRGLLEAPETATTLRAWLAAQKHAIADDAKEQPPAMDNAAAVEDANRAITAEFVEKELSYFNCRFEGGQEFVDKLNSLSQSLHLDAYDLIKWTLMLAWVHWKKTMDVNFLDSFEQCYKMKEHENAWATCWGVFNELVDLEAKFGIADDAEEQQPAKDNAAAVDDANRANAAKIVFAGGMVLGEIDYYVDEYVVEDEEMILDEHDDRPEMSIRTRPTDEQIAQAQALREQDESDPADTRFTRACLVCATKNPRKRAVFTPCGHIVCYPCAVENARSDATDGHCVFCRSTGGFVMLFEEYGSDDVNEGN